MLNSNEILYIFKLDLEKKVFVTLSVTGDYL